MVESPQRVLSPGLAGQDESVRERTAAIGVISPDRIGSANIIGQFAETMVGPRNAHENRADIRRALGTPRCQLCCSRAAVFTASWAAQLVRIARCRLCRPAPRAHAAASHQRAGCCNRRGRRASSLAGGAWVQNDVLILREHHHPRRSYFVCTRNALSSAQPINSAVSVDQLAFMEPCSTPAPISRATAIAARECITMRGRSMRESRKIVHRSAVRVHLPRMVSVA